MSESNGEKATKEKLIRYGIPDAAAAQYAVNLAVHGFTNLHDVHNDQLSTVVGVKKGHLRMINAGIGNELKKEAETLLAPEGDFSDWSSVSDPEEPEESEDEELARLIAEDEARIAKENARFESGLVTVGKEEEEDKERILRKSR